MKITNADVIKRGEAELINRITEDLDWQQIQRILEQKYDMKLADARAAYRGGELQVQDNRLTYSLAFETTVTLSVRLDRRGECLDVEVGAPDEEEAGDASAENEGEAVAPEPPEEKAADTDPENKGDMAADIADMIADINRD